VARPLSSVFCDQPKHNHPGSGDSRPRRANSTIRCTDAILAFLRFQSNAIRIKLGLNCCGSGGLQSISALWVGIIAAAGVNSATAEPRSALPILIFQTQGQTILDRTRTPGTLTIFSQREDPLDGLVAAEDSGKAELSVRGNSSFFLPKKSYRLELQDKNGNDRKASLLGLPADSDWVLYASATDRTFERNLLAHELWRRMGHYAVRWKFVEVFVVTNSGIGELTKEVKLDRPHPGLFPQEKKVLVDAKLVVDRPHPIHESNPGRRRGNETQTLSKQGDQSPVTSTPTIQSFAGEVSRVLNAISVTNPAAASLSFSNANNSVASTLANSYMGVYVLMEKLKRGKERVDIKTAATRTHRRQGHRCRHRIRGLHTVWCLTDISIDSAPSDNARLTDL